MRSKVLLVLTAILIPVFLKSQVLPVEVDLTFPVSFKGYLPDQLQGEDGAVVLIITLNDLSLNSYAVAPDFHISGNGVDIRTSSFNASPPIILQPGIPFLLEGIALQTYLDPQFLEMDGFSQEQYESRRTLPPGTYDVCVQILDYYNPSNVAVSENFCRPLNVVYEPAPLCDMPYCADTLASNDPQSVSFHWTGSTSSTVEYTFELFEMPPGNIQPEEIPLVLQPIYQVETQEQNVTLSSFDVLLNDGNRYLWRVQASDPDGIITFHNNGFSELCLFYWGENIPDLSLFPIQLSGTTVSHRQLRFIWNEVVIFENYELRIRKTGTESWHSIPCPGSPKTISDLLPGISYEAQVRGIMDNEAPGFWSNGITLSTNPEPVYTCNETLIPSLNSSYAPLLSASANMIVQIGQFEMTLKTINPLPEAGFYSGTGQLKIFAGITTRVIFQAIFIDAEHNIRSGEVETVSEGISSWTQQWNYSACWNYQGNIDTLFLDQNGNIIIINANGDTTFLQEDHQEGLLITDNEGNQWIVNPDGSVTIVNANTLLPQNNHPLSEKEKTVLKKAMLMIQNEFTTTRIEELRTQWLQKNSLIEERIMDEKDNYDLSQLNSHIIPGPCELAGNLNSAISGTGQINKEYKTSERLYSEGRLLQLFATVYTSDNDLNLIGNHLVVNGKSFKTFIEEGSALNLSEDQLAEKTVLLGIKPLIQIVVKKKMDK